MSTSMHRLQISLPPWQMKYLQDRARREGVSLAETIRRLIAREADSAPAKDPKQSLMALAGFAEDTHPLIDDVPVSESPDLYLTSHSQRDNDA